MESNDSYPVFHTRLTRTLRRRLTRPDGTSAGWLIITAANPFVEVAVGFAATPDDLAALGHESGDSVDRIALNRDGDTDDPPQLAIPRQR